MVGEDFEAVERELHAQFIAAERGVPGECLERLDIDASAVEIDQCRYHRVLDSTEYTTAVGTVRVRRTPYRCGRERAVVPMELRAGIVEGHWTPLAAHQANHMVAEMTSAHAETTLRELVRSERFDPAWTMLSKTYRQEATVPDNVVAFPHKRAA